MSILHRIVRETHELPLGDVLTDASRPISYRTVPPGSQLNSLTWRIRLSATGGGMKPIYLELNKECTIGRFEDSAQEVTGLFDAQFSIQLGLSRKHLLIRPTETNLLIMDLGSTNGTFLNSTRLTPMRHYNLTNEDRISLGQLELVVTILERPRSNVDNLKVDPKIRLDAPTLIPKIARTLTSILDVSETMKTALHLATFHTGARHLRSWLVDEKTGVPHLVYAQDERTSALGNREQRQLAETAAGFAPEVIRTGKPVLVKKKHQSETVKAVTPLMDALFCYPLKVGDTAIGAIAGIYADANTPFTQREEQILESIAEFAAISVHNGLQYASVGEILVRREKLLTGFSHILGNEVKSNLRLIMNATTALNHQPNLPDHVHSTGQDILLTCVQTSSVLDQMIELSALCQNPTIDEQMVDLSHLVDTLCAEIEPMAEARMTRIERRLYGEPYPILGDERLLYISLYKLLDNAVRHTPPRTSIQFLAQFEEGKVTIIVRDNGEGFLPADLPHLMDHYYHRASMSDEYAGLGLGLEFVRTTIESHRGTFLLRNADDGGAECILQLPTHTRQRDELHDTLLRRPFAMPG